MVHIEIKRGIPARAKVGCSMMTDSKARDQITVLGIDLQEGFITEDEYNYSIDLIMLELLDKDGHSDLVDLIYMIKAAHNPCWHIGYEVDVFCGWKNRKNKKRSKNFNSFN